MKLLIFLLCLTFMQLQAVQMAAIETDDDDGETSLHFDYKTENGQQRVEDIKYGNKKPTTNLSGDTKQTDEADLKPVEFRGGYSFISADGYVYTVKYKANKNGFQPYVTAHKLKSSPAVTPKEEIIA